MDLWMTLQYPNYGIIMICGIAEHYGFGNPNIRNSVICNPQLIRNCVMHHVLRFTIITMYMYHKIIHYYIKKLYKLLSSFAYFFQIKYIMSTETNKSGRPFSEVWNGHMIKGVQTIHETEIKQFGGPNPHP